MELRAFLAIFGEHKRIFWGIILAALVAGGVFFVLQSERYSVSLTLNVARTGTVDQDAEDFGGFYRLQADERFADTVVRWLQSPRIVEDILRAAGVSTDKLSDRALRSQIDARRLSSQVVDVRFAAPTPEQGKAEVQAIVNTLNAATISLNDDAIGRGTWFRLVAGDPVIRFYEHSFTTIIALSLLLGFFSAFVVVVFVHYYKEDITE